MAGSLCSRQKDGKWLPSISFMQLTWLQTREGETNLLTNQRPCFSGGGNMTDCLPECICKKKAGNGFCFLKSPVWWS